MLLLNLSCIKPNDIRSTKELSIALAAAPTSLDPRVSTDATGMRMVSLLYQGLVQVNSSLKPSSDLAHKWTYKEGIFHFFISRNKKFSDGSPISCADILQSIQSYQLETCPFKAIFEHIKSPTCTVDDDNLILKFHYSENKDKFLLADLPVLKIFKDSVGSGPFTLNSQTPSKIVLTPNPYYDEKQGYDLIFYILKDDFARFLKTYKGEIDIAPNSIPFEKIDSFKNTKFKIFETPSLSTSYLLINLKNPFLNQLNTRTHILKKIDIKSLVKDRFNNHVTQALSLLYPKHPYYNANLSEVKFPKLKKIEPSLLTFKTSNNRQSRETGNIISQKLRTSGLPVILQSFEWGTFYRDIKNGNYDLALMKWVGVLDPDIYNIAFHSSEFPPGRNRGFYKNKTLDGLLEKASQATETSKRKTLYNSVQKIVYQDLAIIPLWHENQINIIHPDIKGFKPNPMGDFSSLLNLQLNRGDNL